MALMSCLSTSIGSNKAISPYFGVKTLSLFILQSFHMVFNFFNLISSIFEQTELGSFQVKLGAKQSLFFPCSFIDSSFILQVSLTNDGCNCKILTIHDFKPTLFTELIFQASIPNLLCVMNASKQEGNNQKISKCHDVKSKRM